MQERLNNIKDREDFRPVAPVVLEEDAADWFQGATVSPFMLFVFDVCADKAERIPAVRHVDGTARVQTVNRRQNAVYYDLLQAFKRRTGVPVLVNTSFNTRGEPIVCTPRDAVESFWTSPLDALVIGSYLLEKTSNPAMSAAISVIVPTFHRDALLEKCLKCLIDQTLPRSSYEVIVADDAPSESTARLLESLACPAGPELRYVPVTATQGPAGAEHRVANGPGALAGIYRRRLPARSRLAGRRPQWTFACRCRLGPDTGSAGQSTHRLSARHRRPADGRVHYGQLLPAALGFGSVGGFDERFTAAWREDHDLHFGLLERGLKIVRCEQAMVVHPAPEGSWGASLSKQSRGIFDPLLHRKHAQLYRQRIAPLPCGFYVAVLGMAAFVAGAARDRRWSPRRARPPGPRCPHGSPRGV